MFRARLKRRMRFCENLLDKVLPFAAAGSYVTIRPSVPSIPHFQVYTISSIQISEVYTISSIQISEVGYLPNFAILFLFSKSSF